MKFNRLNIIIFIGLLAIVGVLFMQLLTLSQAYAFEKKEFSEKIHFALQDVVAKIHKDNKTEVPVTSQIKKITDDYYIVNVDDVFEASVLEYYLKTEFQKVKLNIDYEYAIYDCSSDEMMYGKYVSSSDKKAPRCEKCFTKKEGLVYYFAIRFPQLKYNYITSLQQYWIYTGVLVLVLVIYVYSVLLLIKQKKYTELQTDFINNMTHEFKTPISSILIASNYAKSQEEITKNPKLSKYVQIIIEQSNKLNQHIEKILHIAKSDSHMLELEKTRFNMFDVISLAKETILLKYGKEISIEIQSDRTEYPIVADEFHFSNVVYNILDNAIKYNDSAPKILIVITENQREVKLEFIDNGIGIETPELNAIFDKFYRISSAKRNEVGGFGLGLFYVKKICTLHRWKINVKNNPDNGITVTISIPK
ncbi:MAG: HAMP domain-containing histidine kinase [Flavobacterium lindanitolerans]|uniref:sensor histidine kinase n=1 Tax=Flavobacterium lindanitolerans TaxID=428988 RepID=UPI001A55462A|nr:HAMP domain-containing sensor histidine kinase [Flavobacterium lindanitolerans]MBL7867805.1 HAMP domain-containing histidine kinase [Flavobacterium lindanitolerans]